MAKAGKQDGGVISNSVLACNNRNENTQYKFPSNYIRTTKYTIITFLPMNLYEQFQKMSNVFFFLNMVVALVPGVSPVFPATTILPLVFVLGVAALRDGYEDYQRYLSDKRANGLEVKMVDAMGKLQTVASKDIQVGDVVYLERGSEVPVDCLLIGSSVEDGSCYVETANLDGETNIKTKQTKSALHQMFTSPETIAKFSGKVECDGPNNSMHKWQGKISVPGIGDQSVDMDNFLLRGCMIRNLDWVMAVTVYTGVNTKLFLNLTQKPPKASRLDKKLNRLIIMILVFQQCIILLICGLHVAFRNSDGQSFYISHFTDAENDAEAYFTSYMTFFILLSLMMPISLFVSLEFCKTAQAKLMEWDDGMTNVRKPGMEADRMRARTSSLNEELSQVQYIFSDKTGTLTENQMRFAKAFAGTNAYDELSKPGGMLKDLNAMSQRGDTNSSDYNDILGYLRLLVLNNTLVITNKADGTTEYDGASTDEIALHDCAMNNGNKLLARTSDTMTVSIQKQVQTIDIEAVLPFTPERKMMSIVVKEKDGTMRLYTKGADSNVMARLDNSKNNGEKVRKAQSFLDMCATEGLRTLACTERVFTPGEYKSWRAKWDAACLDISPERSNLVHEAALDAENKMVLLGCTAIEDRLQDEVPETIKFLLRCGIVVWVLTGDKRETALNISTTSNLLNPQTDLVIHLDIESGVPVAAQIDEASRRVKQATEIGQKSSFIVDGRSLEEILKEATFEKFRQLGLLVNSAVCCRVTPLQKASVVAMFQELGSTCLGVGDGANDVSMIQEAKVGIGILGLEGSQAERAADYAIPRFRHLRRLIAVHGRYSLVRNSMLIQYSFYKNIVYSLTQVFYAFETGFSGQTIYDSWVLTFFNMMFTFLPPVAMGVFDYDVAQNLLLRYPGLYAELRSAFAIRMSRASSFVWFTLSLLHSWIVYYGVYRSAMVKEVVGEGQSGGLWTSGTIMMNVLLTVVILEAACVFLTWTHVHLASIVLSFAGYVFFIFIYAEMPPEVIGEGATYYQVPHVADAAAVNWLTLLLLGVVVFAPQVMLMVTRRSFFGIDAHYARAKDRSESKSLNWKEVDEPLAEVTKPASPAPRGGSDLTTPLVQRNGASPGGNDDTRSETSL